MHTTRRTTEAGRHRWRGLVTVVALALMGIAIGPTAVAHHIGSQWVATGDGVTTLSDGTDTAPRFQYEVTGRSGAWAFLTTASTAETKAVPYTWTGFHAFFQVRTSLAAVVYSSTGELKARQVLVDDGPVDCCEAPSDGFDYSGVVEVDVQAGDRFGFELSGSHFDIDNRLLGTFTVDTPAPELQLPTPAPVEATGPEGAIVDFVVSAQDPHDGPIAAECTPATGSMFGLGTTTVTCTAEAADQGRATGSFPVLVQDTTAPRLVLPDGPLAVDAETPRGAVVDYNVAADDIVDGRLSPTCAPTSGAVFPVGTTAVSCTVSDSTGNASSGRFDVTVRGAAQQADRLADSVVGVGPGKSLSSKVRQVQRAIAQDKHPTAINVLGAFRNQVRAQAGKSIPAQTAAALREAASRIAHVLTD